MVLRFIGEAYDLLLKGFFIVVIAIIILYIACEAIDDIKEKIKRKKDKN